MIKEIKYGKAPGEDEIVKELVKVGVATLQRMKEFKKVTERQCVTEKWKNAIINLIFKKQERLS